MEPRYKYKICVLGNRTVGKTSLVKRFVFSTFSGTYMDTIGVNLYKKETIVGSDRSRARLMIWDVGGSKGIGHVLSASYLKGTRAVLVVCDITNRESFEDLQEWIKAFQSTCGKIPFIVVGNKSDLVQDVEVTEDDIANVSHKYGSRDYILTSAKTDSHVDTAFLRLAEEVFSQNGIHTTWSSDRTEGHLYSLS